ncbi:DUF2092 domain-containing protein [Pedococcus sp. KACC 23699]|uniref:DUF2092 domain-containing protein n=1 Tax=Pedococcus sp. KACC 23699 TaxID=3149228 RepID=A0AAU7JW68_9MICO
MSLFTERPALRWAAPVGAAALVAAVALVAGRSASAVPSLPPRTPAQLLADVQQARPAGLSGTVVQTSKLGLPELPGVNGFGGGSSSSLSSTVTGTHTWRLWYAGPTRSRLALVGSLGESDVIRNGRDLWVWSSTDKSATHALVPDEVKHASAAPPALEPDNLPKTPQDAARLALAAVDPTTSVTTSGATSVAGRSAYDLLLRPKDADSLVSQVRISVDAQEHIPLRVQVYSTKAANPAFEVGFTAVSFAKPEASQFAFNPPPGTTVKQATLPTPGAGVATKAPQHSTSPRPTVVGRGWASVVVTKLPTQATSRSASSGQLARLLRTLPTVSGSWGRGHLLNGTLFSAVLTDDGRLAIGAVTPQRLYAALAAK